MQVMVIVGFTASAVYITTAQFKMGCSRQTQSKVNRIFIFAFICGVFCANSANWFLFPEMLSQPIAVRLMQAGFSFYYGMLGFFAIAAVLLRLAKEDPALWVNQIVPSVLIFHAISRIGCSFEGCCYGLPISAFGVTFDFPAREIESFSLFVLFFVFTKRIKTHRFAWYLASYSVIRFCLEFGRADNRGVLLVDWLSPAQLTSVMIWISLVVWLAWQRVGGSRNVPSAV